MSPDAKEIVRAINRLAAFVCVIGMFIYIVLILILVEVAK